MFRPRWKLSDLSYLANQYRNVLVQQVHAKNPAESQQVALQARELEEAMKQIQQTAKQQLEMKKYENLFWN